MKAWEVLRPDPRGRCRVEGEPHKLIDIVFTDDNTDAEQQRRSLINHDGYAADIVVRIRKKR